MIMIHKTRPYNKSSDYWNKFAKNSNHSNTTENDAKNETQEKDRLIVYEEEYLDSKTLQKKPTTNRVIEQLCDRMVTIIRDNTNIRTINQYLTQYENISRATFYRWKDIYPLVAQAHEIVLGYFAARAEKEVENDYRWIYFNQPHYDKYVFVENAKFWSELKQKEQSNQSPTKDIPHWKGLTSS